MDFTPEVEDEVIKEAVSHKIDRTLFNSPNKVWRDSTQYKPQLQPSKLVTL